MLEASPLLTYALDWVNLLLRWTHVIVAIAWAGALLITLFVLVLSLLTRLIFSRRKTSHE